MIKEKRIDTPARELKDSEGNVRKVIPACYCIHYYGMVNGGWREIAVYTSEYVVRDEIRRAEYALNDKYLDKDMKKGTYQRALDGEHKELFRELFEKVGADENTAMTEYLNI